MSDSSYDVCIAGAGPAGATCAHYLAKAGLRVALLEKARFPRDKICGDAVCFGARRYLDEMGVMAEIVEKRQGCWSELGGLVAPSGTGFIGNSVTFSGEELVIAVKRKILDEKIARAAQRAGAELREHHTFTGATLAGGAWTVKVDTDDGPAELRARALVAADGAHSHVTKLLGIDTPPPDGLCSRAYVKAGTHDFDADGVAFYVTDLLPGYAALFREADGDLNFCTYLIPGGRAKLENLREYHEKLLAEHPQISKAVGSRAEIQKMQGAPLRLGGTRKTYYDHLLVVGDAAGHIDPLTGEGIHTAIEGGFLAAKELAGALAANDLSARRLAAYERAWMKAFGEDFRWSARMARVYTRFPIFVEASARVMQKEGARALYEWGRMMTGAAPKTGFLDPRLFGPILFEAGKLLLGGRRSAEVLYVKDGEKKIWQSEAPRKQAVA
ncbi:MAG TPA: NAD(P)/FAD-dependent oxidoreductase [Myxococcales bacterium]|nr:NAD(P)/FAD-dependent oxidoreductase [Myxococcales bacterium]